jgi:hypothetical protein
MFVRSNGVLCLLPGVKGRCPRDGKRKFVFFKDKAQALCALFGSEDVVILSNLILGTCQGRSPLERRKGMCVA